MKRIGILIMLLTANLANGCSVQKRKPAAELKTVSRSEWQAAPAKPYKSNRPVRITVHHEGTLIDSSKNVAQFIKNIQTWGMGKDRNWADVPYHFFIGPDGRVYEGRDVFTAGETATEYDPSGHLLISCLGNFEKQEVPQRQLDALVALIAQCNAKYNIPADSLGTHRDHSSKTTCPGKNLYKYFADGSIAKRVKALEK
ncbi:N-acetylmuramoyl-L-alanine amidase [Pedobacter yulinensis]|uniref:N-acetylmuramoyl-L-alanine amidase n=1 Tax=Pedobacter yulinensis TaxID=2126353 RepID=A0A2T3HP06_9SPHI|nr:peptidoglycan recognition family protein [Pedobacter yulinensis]PST84172.1 N-acetylmuramoyl-L-alanine amidase [Pedobacter yulinensis]